MRGNAAHSEKIVLTMHTFGLGGTDRVSAYLARGFADHGFDTEVLVFGRGGPAEDILRPLLGNDVRVAFLGRASARRTADLARYFPAFVRRLKATKPDCIVSTANNMNWITALARGAAGLKSCGLALKTTNPIVRGAEKGFAKSFRRLGYKRAFAAADAVWTLSDAETRQLRVAFPKAAQRIRTVFNPYVTQSMLATTGERPLSGKKQVIAIGRLTRQKRLDLLVRAFAEIEPSLAELTIVGEGEERSALENLVRELSIDRRVKLKGFVGDVTGFLKGADLLVLPSIHEGLPAVVLEAMAANCPVVATDCFPSARELLTNADGCAILDAPEPASLARMITDCLAQPRPLALRNRAAAYSIEAGVASHVEALRALLHRRRAMR